MRGAPDLAIWEFAGANGLAVVTKDDDFRSLALFRGPPSKVIWLSVGNAGTTAIAGLLRLHRVACRRLRSRSEGITAHPQRRGRPVAVKRLVAFALGSPASTEPLPGSRTGITVSP